MTVVLNRKRDPESLDPNVVNSNGMVVDET